ncbi:outer envelope protein 61-like [Oryza brachyantha]|nr:outer envelope protein 61-like [Oryza brachyantha]
MDPEMMRVAQEQMSRRSPADLAALQQQLASNPGLLRFAAESVKNLSPDDVRRAARQLGQARPEEMLDMSRKLAAASADELTAMKAQAEAEAEQRRVSQAVSSAGALKARGNQLHGLGRYAEAAAQYRLAADSLRAAPPSREARSLQVLCAVNLMSCHLKTRRFQECVDEGSEVLAYDPGNVKAYYRRGQAYRELGKLEQAVADLRRARELSPDEDAIAGALRDAQEKLALEMEAKDHPRPRGGVVIEEIVEEEEPSSSQTRSSSTSGYIVSEPSDPAADAQESMMMSFFMNGAPAMSPEDLDRAVRLVVMDGARQVAEAARKAKELLLGANGLVLPIAVLVLAVVFHQLGFVSARWLQFVAIAVVRRVLALRGFK